MVEVALVNPGRHYESPVPPLNLGYIASYLEKHGVSVVIVDEQTGQKAEVELTKINPDIVGLTATTVVAPDAYVSRIL